MLAFGPTHPYIAAEIYSSISTKADQFPALCASVIPQRSLSAVGAAGETHDEYATGLQSHQSGSAHGTCSPRAIAHSSDPKEKMQ